MNDEDLFTSLGTDPYLINGTASARILGIDGGRIHVNMVAGYLEDVKPFSIIVIRIYNGPTDKARDYIYNIKGMRSYRELYVTKATCGTTLTVYSE